MPSVIEGYNYDIFISYRQKDNKGDMWVSEFVEALKTELESTFKEEISVYFDINPHDGLLETHDVDESLKEKLKCLVFIPIISRTYCDPKSFAWEHEFRAFVEQASKDQLGLKIKLPNGNVASRVLPVQIHELDNEDVSMCESVLGSILRGIEFIYKSAGVNRPLRGSEDHPQDNLNKTYYRDQINKVANAIKEIISAIKHPKKTAPRISEESVFQKPAAQKARISKFFAGSIFLLLLVAAGLLLLPKLFKSTEKLEKSIAVLPFRNESAGQENSAFVNGLMEKTLNNLQLIKDFRVIPRTTVEQYRKLSKSIYEIARELSVNYIVEGSAQKYGNTFSLSVRLIKANKKEELLWGKSYEEEISGVDDILRIQSKIAQAIAKALEAKISAKEKQMIEKIPTRNLTALDFYQTGREEYIKYQNDIFNTAALDNAEDLYKKSLKYDTSFAQAYLGLAQVYIDKHAQGEKHSENYMDDALKLVNTALSYDKDLAEAYLARGYYYFGKRNKDKALEEFNKAIEINPSLWKAYQGIARLFLFTDHLEAIKNLQEAMSVARGNDLAYLLGITGQQYRGLGFTEIGEKYIEEKLKLDNDSASYFESLGNIYFGNSKSYKYWEKALKADSTNLDLLFNIGCYFGISGNNKKALVYIEKWLGLLDQTLVARFSGWQYVGYIYWKNNRLDEANHYFDLQVKYSTELINKERIYNWIYYPYYDRAGVYAFRGQKEKAYKDLMNLMQGPVLPAYMVEFLKIDPLFDNIRDEPQFKQITRDIEAKFQAEHERIRIWLEENGKL